MMTVTIDASDLRADLRALGETLKDVSPSMRRWGREDFIPATIRTMRAVGVAARGGTDARLQAAGLPPWRPWAIQYRRKTDGVTVPAWGGVPKAATLTHNAPGRRKAKNPKVFRGRELVLGRMRRRGQRAKTSDQMLEDTKQMVRGALGAPKAVTPNSITYEASAEYAGHATGAGGGRHWLFIAPQDEALLVKQIERQIDALIRARGMGA
jgi:hypothetical protein